jgi:hypothetical protein
MSMMGARAVLQKALFDSFNLEHCAPMDHLLRSIGHFVDPSSVREHLRRYLQRDGLPLDLPN